MNQNDLDSIRDAVRSVIEEHRISCPISHNAAQTLESWSKNVEEIGEGNIPKGLVSMRKNHLWARTFRRVQSKVIWWAARGIGIALITLILYIGINTISVISAGEPITISNITKIIKK